MGWKETLLGVGASVATGGGSSVATSIIGGLSKVADKLWVDKSVRDTNMAAISIAVTNAARDGDLAEFEAEKVRAKDIRESGFLSKQVRPVIALTFHFFFWYAFAFDPKFATKVKTVIVEWGELKITVGAMYVLIICFYFLTKGIKDYLIGKNPSGK